MIIWKDIKDCFCNMRKSGTKTPCWLWVIVIVLLALLAVAIGYYRYYFNGEISTDHTLWSEFGDYLSGVAGLLNVIAFAGITIIIHLIEKDRKASSTRLQAEEKVVERIKTYSVNFMNQYMAFLRNAQNNNNIASDTFEYIQPLMTYLYYLKSIDFLPEKTKARIGKIHESLFDSSDIMFCYAEKIEGNDRIIPTYVDVLKEYRKIIRYMAELEVMMLSDIAGVQGNDEDKTNSESTRDKKNGK